MSLKQNIKTAGSHGSISPSGSVQVNYGASQTFTITPNTGYLITNVYIDGLALPPVTNYVFPNVQANHTISATFAHNSAAGGNFDADGKTDLSVFRPLTNAWWLVKYSSNSDYNNQPFGHNTSGDVPVPGDYDGDGKVIWLYGAKLQETGV